MTGQLVIWPDTTIDDNTLHPSADKKDKFIQWIKDTFHMDATFECMFQTLPDVNAGQVVEGTGNRTDLLFRVSGDAMSTFIIQRLSYGIRWWEDYVDSSRAIIPSEVLEKYSKA